MPRQVDTRDQILELAKQVVQTRSFNDFSYQDVAEHLAIRKASVHYHFPTKADLGVALLEEYQQEWAAWIERLAEQALSPPAQLSAYCQLFGEHLAKGGRICPGGIFSAEWNTLPAAMQAALQTLLAMHHAWLTELMRSGQASGHFRAGEPAHLALLVSSSLQGALQLQRAMGPVAIFSPVTMQLHELLTHTSDREVNV